MCVPVGQCASHSSDLTMWRWWRRSAPPSCFDSGAFSFWQSALRRGEGWQEIADWGLYFEWLEPRLFCPGRWAIMPDIPGAPSQLNDSLLSEWPFGQKGAPVWHMDGPIERLLRLCERHDRVCLGWTGPKVGSPDYRARMDEVGRALGNRWPVLHMLRGVQVAFDYPFTSADSTSLAQNGWRYDASLDFGDPWAGRKAYADRLENRRHRGANSDPSRSGRGHSQPHLDDHGLAGKLPIRRTDIPAPVSQMAFNI